MSDRWCRLLIKYYSIFPDKCFCLPQGRYSNTILDPPKLRPTMHYRAPVLAKRSVLSFIVLLLNKLCDGVDAVTYHMRRHAICDS
jgi:hypothetical protein